MALSREENRDPWKIEIRANGSADLFLYGDIVDAATGRSDVTAKRFSDDLKQLGETTELTLRINSAGGSVWAAIAMYNELRRHPARKIAQIDALAASAATLVMMACDEIVMSANARIMIHNPISGLEGDAAAFMTRGKMLLGAGDVMADAYCEKTRLTREEIVAMMDAETWMTADEAQRYGFCDRVENGAPIAAHFKNGALVLDGVQHDLNRYRHAPTDWEKIERKTERVKTKLGIRNEVIEGVTSIMATCPACGHEFQVVVDPQIVGDTVEIEIELPIETTAQAQELVAKARALEVRNSISAGATCPSCGNSFDVTVEDGPAGEEAAAVEAIATDEEEVVTELEETLIDVIEELLDEELDVPTDPVEAKAYLRGVRAAVKARNAPANATARKGSVALATRVKDARASGAYGVKASSAPAVNAKAAQEAKRTETGEMIAKYANKGKEGKKNG